MRKNIMYHYKHYDGTYLNKMDQQLMESFNEYGYNFCSNKKREKESFHVVGKSGPNCVPKQIKKVKE